MNKRILGRFKENEKWKDYYNLKSFECRMSLIMTMIISLFFYFMGIYDDFKDYLTPLQNMTIYIAQALIGMLGVILAGLAIIVGVLNKDSINSIEKINGKGSIQKVLVSFEFLTFNIGMGIFVFFLINFILYSEKNIVPVVWFYCLLAVISYFLSFIIFYTVSLTSNCIRVFYINDLYANISHKEKSIYEEVNEVRIDYLLYYLHKTAKLSPEELLEDLDKFVDSTNISDKEAVKKYLKSYYGVSKE
ncbi:MULTISPECIES: hypothetical protein [Bacillus cereus group]|uniref:hypothetical protein n=1 Tax=Bacillus cereus group TaxID=86661 RepID=UPI0000E89DE9|nr:MULTISPECIES: hypothetical protein [Bacillus cereus group]ABK84491.1 hypothetical protein BALH_1135 [Bacillus thuringiensis str. Al Hakam]AJH67563.1 hypothetical protein BF32_4415 [Bacillus thuringiensis]PGY97786.1 hypothetical protein COE05_02815 [Bacillus cereus]QKH30195.1 hypothetical protein FOC87_11065 [Bacillus thuringiensis]QKQ41330.1 hypothetical protein FOC85_19290 [Bacillus thuringiensis]